MVVVQINSECGRGSTGKIVCSISRLLTDNQIENYILYSGNHKSDFANSIQINSKLSIRLHQLLSRVFGDQGFHSYISTKRMIRKIRRIAPDVIALHNLHGYYLHLGVLFRFLKKYNKPVYWTLHDCWAFTGHCTHFQISGCEKWKTGCKNCESLNMYPYSWFFDRSKALYNKKKKLFCSLEKLHIITPSVWLADLVKQSFLSEYPVTVINNGIDLNIFKPTKSDFREKHNIDNRPMVLGVAAIWSNRKGLDVFIELAKTHNEWNYVLVGTDDTVDKLLPPNIVSIHRTTNQAELAEIYSAADVFLNPTREEVFGLVNAEALACGTPVLTFNTGGSPEIIDKGCGTVVTKGDIEAVVSAISALGCSETYSAEACLERAKCFDSNFCYQQYLNLFVDMETKQ